MKKGVQSFFTVLHHVITLSDSVVFSRDSSFAVFIGTLVFIFFSVVVSFEIKHISRSLEIQNNVNLNLKHSN